MGLHHRAWAGTWALATVLAITGSASAQKSGGILRLHHFDSPASMSILEEFDPRRRTARDGCDE